MFARRCPPFAVIALFAWSCSSSHRAWRSGDDWEIVSSASAWHKLGRGKHCRVVEAHRVAAAARLTSATVVELSPDEARAYCSQPVMHAVEERPYLIGATAERRPSCSLVRHDEASGRLLAYQAWSTGEVLLYAMGQPRALPLVVYLASTPRAVYAVSEGLGDELYTSECLRDENAFMNDTKGKAAPMHGRDE